MHDPRVGRFFAVDPLAYNYPHNSPYAFSENDVISHVELEGLEKRHYTINLLDDDPKLKLVREEDCWFWQDRVIVKVTGLPDYQEAVYTFTIWGKERGGYTPGSGTGNYIEDFDRHFKKDPIASIYSNEYRPNNEIIKETARDIALSLLIGRALKTSGSKQQIGLSDAKFAQKAINKRREFSPDGQAKYTGLAGKPIKTVDDLANAIKTKAVSTKDITVDYVIRNGEKVILNTRTSTALKKAGVPMSEWGRCRQDRRKSTWFNW